MLIHPVEIDQASSAAVWSFNSESIAGGILYHMVVSALTPATTYNFTVTDDQGNIIYLKTGAAGTHREEVVIPVRGVLTLAVDTASADEAFTGRLMVDEGRRA